MDDHVSWSRTCPTFLRKCKEMDRQTPENNLPFFLATEAWTWSPALLVSGFPACVDPPPPIFIRGRNQQERIQVNKDMAPNGCLYERQSWNRSQLMPGRQTSIPPLQPSNMEPPPLSTLLEQTRTDDETTPQVMTSQNRSNA